jgi:hypothetical protein
MWDNAKVEAVFVETSGFTKTLGDYLPDLAYQELQIHLMENPLTGRVVRGCGGIRKLRWPDPRRGKGKRGGLRVMYVYLPELRRFLMLDLYDKDEAEDLSTEERRLLTRLVETYREAALQRQGRT